MVAMAISLVIALAAIAALTAARTGFDAVDEASQLRDNLRFSSDLIYRLASQTGYKDVQYLPSSMTAVPLATASIEGFNNAALTSSPDENTYNISAGNGLNGSDILILRTHGNSDQSLIDCNGTTVRAPTTREERSVSIIYVQMSMGRPALMCTSWTWAPTGTTIERSIQPVVEGVENFQVLYGTDGVTPNAAPTIPADSVTDRYLRADQMVVSSNPAATQENWRRVRSLRIGLVIRGVTESKFKELQTYYPFGSAGTTVGTENGSFMSSSNDPGTVYRPQLTDGIYLRQTLTFTVHLRNDQAL